MPSAILGSVAIIVALWIPVASARTKVAVVNSFQAVLETAEGRNAGEALRDRYREPLQSLESRADKDSQEYRQQREQLRCQVEEERTRVLNDLNKKLNAVLEKYAARKHYEIVLHVSDPKSPVKWFQKTIDITKQVVAEYDRIYPRSAVSH